MRLSRRGFLKGLALTAAGIVVPAVAQEAPARRLWALDGTMLSVDAPPLYTHDLTAEAESFARAMADAAQTWKVTASAARTVSAIQRGVDGFGVIADFRGPTYIEIDGRIIAVEKVEFDMTFTLDRGHLTTLQFSGRDGGRDIAPAMRRIRGRG